MSVARDIADKAREVTGARTPVPRDVEDRIRRGRREMLANAKKRRLCMLFLDGDQYAYLDSQGGLQFLEVNRGVRSGKPAHRIRNRHNFIRPMVDAKVSSSTTRVPGYEVNPSSTDPEDAAAARLAEKVVRQGWQKWGLRRARVKAATLAIGGGGKAYALPYFDSQVGPFRGVPTDDGVQLVGEGEVKILVLNGNEAFCEPGVDWDDSRWYAVETARPIGEVRELDGFDGLKLEPDASTSDVPTDRPSDEMVMVTLFFERPCSKYPQGRMLTIANGRQIVPEGPYPLRQQGRVIDEPCIHRLVYRLDPRKDDDLGLTWELIDFQRSINDTKSKALELKNLALLAQIMAPEGSITEAPSDEPGKIIYFRPIGGAVPQWREPPNPAILAQLQSIESTMKEDMRYIAADADVNVAPNVAIGTVQAVMQQAANRWSQFIDGFAEWDQAVARHCLLLAQEHYTEERILKVRGRFGWEPESSFRGADIMGQVDVTVLPASIETRSRQQMLQTLGWIQANFPGYVRPEIAIEVAMHGASVESIVESFELDKARANEIIQRIRDGSILQMPDRDEMMPGKPDPITGQPGPAMLVQVPSWMPRKFDNVDVQAWVFEQWLKTPDASSLEPHLHEVAMLVYEGFKQLQAQQQAEQAVAQSMQAQQLGEANAARPQEAKPMPSTPSPQEG